jgi:hypothetical protein
MDYFLKFSDQETAASVLGADEDGNIIYATDQRIAEALFGDGIVDGVDGYHVNIRTIGNFEIDEQYVMNPTIPRCVFL